MIAKRDEQLFVLQFLSVTVSAIVKLYTSLSVSPYSFCVLKILLQILSWSKKKLVKKKKKRSLFLAYTSPVNVWYGSLSMF